MRQIFHQAKMIAVLVGLVLLFHIELRLPALGFNLASLEDNNHYWLYTAADVFVSMLIAIYLSFTMMYLDKQSSYRKPLPIGIVASVLLIIASLLQQRLVEESFDWTDRGLTGSQIFVMVVMIVAYSCYTVFYVMIAVKLPRSMAKTAAWCSAFCPLLLYGVLAGIQLFIEGHRGVEINPALVDLIDDFIYDAVLLWMFISVSKLPTPPDEELITKI